MLTGLAQASTVFYMLAGVCAIICISRPDGFSSLLNDWKQYRGLAAALLLSLLVMTLAALRGPLKIDNEIERALRLSVGTLLILGACLSLTPQWLRQATWGLVVATWAQGMPSGTPYPPFGGRLRFPSTTPCLTATYC